jgi:hypothetical protein
MKLPAVPFLLPKGAIKVTEVLLRTGSHTRLGAARYVGYMARMKGLPRSVLLETTIAVSLNIIKVSR